MKIKFISMRFASLLSLLTIFAVASLASAQTPEPKTPSASPGSVERAFVGDAPDDPGPLATDISPAFTHAAIRKVAHKVADWELARTEKTFNQQWTYAAMYDGMLAASKVTGDPRFYDAMVRMGQRFDWKLVNVRFPMADDMAIGKSYMDMYLTQRDPVRMADVKENLDKLIVRPDDPAKLVWWWCDALYMAPPVLAKMYTVTGDRRYLDYMDHEWWLTTASLYDPTDHLYFRDARYLTQRRIRPARNLRLRLLHLLHRLGNQSGNS
jgi:unsaturated rhamnogalacturonyl hydrolase